MRLQLILVFWQWFSPNRLITAASKPQCCCTSFTSHSSSCIMWNRSYRDVLVHNQFLPLKKPSFNHQTHQTVSLWTSLKGPKLLLQSWRQPIFMSNQNVLITCSMRRLFIETKGPCQNSKKQLQVISLCSSSFTVGTLPSSSSVLLDAYIIFKIV